MCVHRYVNYPRTNIAITNIDVITSTTPKGCLFASLIKAKTQNEATPSAPATWKVVYT